MTARVISGTSPSIRGRQLPAAVGAMLGCLLAITGCTTPPSGATTPGAVTRWTLRQSSDLAIYNGLQSLRAQGDSPDPATRKQAVEGIVQIHARLVGGWSGFIGGAGGNPVYLNTHLDEQRVGLIGECYSALYHMRRPWAHTTNEYAMPALMKMEPPAGNLHDAWLEWTGQPARQTPSGNPETSPS